MHVIWYLRLLILNIIIICYLNKKVKSKFGILGGSCNVKRSIITTVREVQVWNIKS